MWKTAAFFKSSGLLGSDIQGAWAIESSSDREAYPTPDFWPAHFLKWLHIWIEPRKIHSGRDPTKSVV